MGTTIFQTVTNKNVSNILTFRLQRRLPSRASISNSSSGSCCGFVFFCLSFFVVFRSTGGGFVLVETILKTENMSIIIQTNLNSSSDKINIFNQTQWQMPPKQAKTQNFRSKIWSMRVRRFETKGCKWPAFCFYCFANACDRFYEYSIQSRAMTSAMVFKVTSRSSLNCKITRWKIAVLLELLASFNPVA